MTRIRRLLLLPVFSLVLVCAGAVALWLFYGESVRVLGGLVTASGETLPPLTTCRSLTLEGGATIVVVNHPKTGERCYIDVQMLPGAPRPFVRLQQHP